MEKPAHEPSLGNPFFRRLVPRLLLGLGVLVLASGFILTLACARI